jgi:hypothetical protein
LGVRRVTNPQGCSSLGDPGVWSFTAPRLNGTISGTLAATCYTFNRAAAEPDGAYWFRSVRTSGTLNPTWRVYTPTGDQMCSGTSGDYQRCALQDSGQHLLVIEDSSRTSTGAYFLTAKRTTQPDGCTTLPSIAFGLPTVAGNLSAIGEVDCYRLQGFAGDDLTFHASGAADRLAVVDATGVNRCTGGANFGCALSGAGPYSVLVYPSDTDQSGSYTFSATCNNIPCGQSETTVTDVTPNRIGPSSFTTLLLRGRDLHLLASAKLTRDGVIITGEPEAAAEDGRARPVRFNTASATNGAWNLEATFLDGTTRTITPAITIEALRPPSITAELIGRDVFRVGQPTTVSVVVKNTGNVDGLSTPIAISGIPQGATITSLTDLYKPVGPDTNLTTAKSTFNQEADTFTKDGLITVPFVVSRVPAGGSVRLDLQVTVPQASEYAITASAGKCMTPTRLGGQAALAPAANPEQDCYAAVVGGVYEIATEGIPGAGCIQYGVDLYSNYMASINGGESFFSPSNLWGGLWGAIDCATDVAPPTKFAKAGIEIIGMLNTANDLIQDCLLMPETSRLHQRGVASFDPNDIAGPAGRGAERFIQGDAALSYHVYFENLPAATAPAQTVKITNQLDTTKFDVTSVLFSEVRFGSTVYQLPYADQSIDHVVDLRPVQNLLVRVTANVTPGGLITWQFQSLDPETLAPPDDPLAGFLPPNQTSPEGEGRVTYSVRLKSLPSATIVTNKAAIIFDSNPAIETPTWSNTLDKLPPSATVNVTGQADTTRATVTWNGTDDAAGIVLYELRVAKDGGPFTLWHTSAGPGSTTFQAESSGSYSFVVVAHDGASNTAQSSQAAINLVSDATAPTVTATAPAAGAAITTTASATFSEKVTGVSAVTFKVTIAGTSTPVAGVVTQPSPTTAKFTPSTPLVPGQSYTATLTAGIRDTSGNSLAPVTWTFRTTLTVDSTSPAIRAVWDRDGNQLAHGSYYSASTAAGSRKTFTFTGTNAVVYGVRGRTGGYAEIYLDGRKQTTASFYSATTQWKYPVYTKTGLTNTKHTLEVRVTGTKPAASSGTWVYLDAFKVGASLYQENHSNVVDQFRRVASTSAYGGSYEFVTHTTTGDNGGRPSYSVTFRGTDVLVYATKSSTSGQAAIYIDGIYKTTINLRSTSTLYKVKVYGAPPLSNAQHTLRMDAAGTANSAGSGVGLDHIVLR